MAKEEKITARKIDEKSLLASIYAKKNPSVPVVEKPTVDISENIEEPTSLKTNTRKKTAAKSSYSEAYLNKKEKEIKRPSVYIELELHEIISEIVKVLAKKITVGEYIDMILWEHLLKHEDEINSLYCRERDKLIKRKLD